MVVEWRHLAEGKFGTGFAASAVRAWRGSTAENDGGHLRWLARVPKEDPCRNARFVDRVFLLRPPERAKPNLPKAWNRRAAYINPLRSSTTDASRSALYPWSDAMAGSPFHSRKLARNRAHARG